MSRYLLFLTDCLQFNINFRYLDNDRLSRMGENVFKELEALNVL